MNRRLALALLPIIAIIGVIGCQSGALQVAAPATNVTPSAAVTFTSPDDLKPTLGTTEPFRMLMNGSPMNVTVRSTYSNGILALALNTHGEKMDEERYALASNGLSVLTLSGQSFDPALPLVRLPYNGQDDFTWSGTIAMGASKMPAKAEVSAISEPLNTAAGNFQTARVKVALSMEAGAQEPTRRNLVFWIAKGNGVVKLEYGDSVTREPAPKDDANP